MAISFRSAGGVWQATVGTTSNAGLPGGGEQAGDIMLCLVALKPFSASPTIDNGWAAVGSFVADGSVASGNGTGSVLVGAFWKEHTGSESEPTINYGVAGDPAARVVLIFQKGAGETWETPVGDGGGDAVAGTSHSATIASDPGVTAGDMCIAFTGIRDDTVMTVPTFTQSGVTFDAVTEKPATALSSTGANDLSADACYRLATAGTSSAAPVVTSTLSTSETGCSYFIRLRVTAPAVERVPFYRPMTQLLGH